MRAIAIDGFGGREVMRLAELPAPRPAPGEVLVRMAFAGVNPADWKLREGWLNRFEWFRPRFPFVLGYDGAGTIQAVGDEATGFARGDRVAVKSDQSLGRWGTFAEFMSVKADLVGRVPDSVALEHAATLPVSGLTAWHALFVHGRLEPGQSVYINAGAGSVGSFAVQFARERGARVLASCAPRNAAYLMRLGAERTFDYAAPERVTMIREFAGSNLDMILDAAEAPDRTLVDLLRPGGVHVRIPCLGEDDNMLETRTTHQRKLKLVRGGIVPSKARETLEAIGAMLADARLATPAIRIRPLHEAAEALATCKAGTWRGKHLLAIGSDLS